jgi:hypothetical protein
MERGLPPHVVANQLGHTDGGALVQRLYGHPSERGMRDQVAGGEQLRSGRHGISLESRGLRSLMHPPSPLHRPGHRTRAIVVLGKLAGSGIDAVPPRSVIPTRARAANGRLF